MTMGGVRLPVRCAGLLLVACLLCAAPAWAQRSVGEIRLRVTDASGAALTVSGSIEGVATQVRREFATADNGTTVLAALPLGRYEIRVSASGFADRRDVVDVTSEVPVERTLTLSLAPLQTSVTVTADQGASLVNPTRSGSIRFVGGGDLSERASPVPGRSLIDLVAAQPGWLLEANGVLHARGSEYQVQYVIDGIPLRDNRSPAFSQLFGAEEFDAVTVRTGGYPAEFGGKLGGVIEVNTARDARRGIHGLGSAQIGSFGTRGGHGLVGFGGANVNGAVGFDVAATDRYLDPPTEDNLTNRGTAGGVSGRVERAWSASSRTRAYAYGRRAVFDVPNEALQEMAGQRQTRKAFEQLGQLTHQVVASSETLLNVGAMVRHVGATLDSNALAIPIAASQDRSFTETYINGTYTKNSGAHEVRVGGELTFQAIDEQFDARITARRYGGSRVFDADLPETLHFDATRHLREQAVFAQDRVHLGTATLSVGLRYDHYRLVAEEHAVSPRVSVAWAPERTGLVFHGAYDRTFETQPVENILLANLGLDELGDEVASRPLLASRGHFVEGGVSATITQRLRLESTVFHRSLDDATDDEVLLNSGVSFPITFASASITGWEMSADVPSWRTLSASASYSLSKGTGHLPLTGGLFLGDDAELVDSDEAFPLTQDQRHTFQGRIRTSLGSRAWAAASLRAESGLPVEFEDELDDDDLEELAEQFGDAVVARVDFDKGRVRPSWSLSLSGGVLVAGSGTRTLRVQVDAFNVFNRLNVINFAGLLSGTAIASPRSVTVQVRTTF